MRCDSPDRTSRPRLPSCPPPPALAPCPRDIPSPAPRGLPTRVWLLLPTPRCGVKVVRRRPWGVPPPRVARALTLAARGLPRPEAGAGLGGLGEERSPGPRQQQGRSQVRRSSGSLQPSAPPPPRRRCCRPSCPGGGGRSPRPGRAAPASPSFARRRGRVASRSLPRAEGVPRAAFRGAAGGPPARSRWFVLSSSVVLPVLRGREVCMGAAPPACRALHLASRPPAGLGGAGVAGSDPPVSCPLRWSSCWHAASGPPLRPRLPARGSWRIWRP